MRISNATKIGVAMVSMSSVVYIVLDGLKYLISHIAGINISSGGAAWSVVVWESIIYLFVTSTLLAAFLVHFKIKQVRFISYSFMLVFIVLFFKEPHPYKSIVLCLSYVVGVITPLYIMGGKTVN